MDIVLAIIGSGVLSTVVSGIFSLISQRKQSNSAIIAGLMVLLEDRINLLCDKCIKEGSVLLEDKDRIHRMWTAYHTHLGGNGYLDTKMQMLDKLDVKLD